MAKRYFPAFLDLEGRRCVVVGGGKIAVDKIDGLLQAGAEVTVVAPHASSRIVVWAQEGVLQLLRREYRPGDLEGALLVIAATGDPAVNQRVYDEGMRRRLLVNVVDSPAQCNYITPSVVRRGPLLIAISTQGIAPALAAAIRRYLERRLDERLLTFLEQAAIWRRRLRREETSGAVRRARWHRLIGRAAPSLLGVGPPVVATPEMQRSPRIEAHGENTSCSRDGMTVHLGALGFDLLAGRIEALEACQAALAQEERVTRQLVELRHRDGKPLLAGWVVVAEGERAEIFYQTSHPRLARRALRAWYEGQLAPGRLPWQPEAYSGVQAVAHLFRVACGLRSAVPLETEVRGVLRRALVQAGMNHTLTLPLARAFRAALTLAGRVCDRGARRAVAPESLHALIKLAAARIPRFGTCWFAIVMTRPWAMAVKRLLMAEGAATSRILCLDPARHEQLVDDLPAGMRAEGQHPSAHLMLLADGGKGTPCVSQETLRAILTRSGVVRLWVVDAGLPRTMPAEAATLHGVTVWGLPDLIDEHPQSGTHEAEVTAVSRRIALLAAEYHDRRLAQLQHG